MSDAEFAARFPQTSAVIQDGIERQLHTGCQLYVSRAGEVLADCGVGLSSPLQPMQADTINVWLSAGKPLTAVALLQLWERGLFSLDDDVAKFIPEFATGGKEQITIRHLLVHTGGIRNVESGWPDVSWAESIRRICEASVETNWVVGKTAGYHTSSSWFILGELISRLSGNTYAEAIRKDLFESIGMIDTWAALSPAQYDIYGSRIGRIYARERGELQSLDWHSAERCAMPSPGSNTRGPIRELGLFYEMLLNEGIANGQRILTPQTVDALTARHRVGSYDLTLAHTVDFGLGVILDSNLYGADTVPYGYGRYCSPRTFGHGGAQSSQGWCDPVQRLVVAYYFNGRPGEGQHNRRTRSLNEAIFADLGLAD